MSAKGSYISHLECGTCGKAHDHREPQTVCRHCGKSLLARYDLEAAGKILTRSQLAGRERTLWRYWELLPVLDERNRVSLGEGYTPLQRLLRLEKALGVSQVMVKDESYNATGSFKARGIAVAVSKAVELGIRECCMPTAGNAGSALAAYGAAAGLQSHIYLPNDTPAVNVRECLVYGVDMHRVEGTISDAAKRMNEERAGHKWFDLSTLKEPYRLEGKKTMGFELAEQYNWQLPDVIVYPTGGGTGLIGMWKAFHEMEQLGWIDSHRPKMVTVQSSGCAPIVRAFEAGAAGADFWDGAATVASGLRVPKPFADGLILQVLRESHGHAVSVNDKELLSAMKEVAGQEGVLLCPEGAAAIAAIPHLQRLGIVDSSTSILVYNTGSALKYGEAMGQAVHG